MLFSWTLGVTCYSVFSNQTSLSTVTTASFDYKGISGSQASLIHTKTICVSAPYEANALSTRDNAPSIR